jgi:hypothetical protein
MPLGQVYEGDWQLHGELEVLSCGSRRPRVIDVTVTFDDMRLEVTPREPNLLERIREDWFHRGSLLGELVRGAVPRPEPRALECPPSGARATAAAPDPMS